MHDLEASLLLYSNGVVRLGSIVVWFDCNLVGAQRYQSCLVVYELARRNSAMMNRTIHLNAGEIPRQLLQLPALRNLNLEHNKLRGKPREAAISAPLS